MLNKHNEIKIENKEQLLPDLGTSKARSPEPKSRSNQLKYSQMKCKSQDDQTSYEFVPKFGEKLQASKEKNAKETIEQRLKELTGPIKSDLIEYVKKNPRNMKMLRFLNKHYKIEYDVLSNRWSVKDEPEFENYGRSRVKSFDDREEQKEESNFGLYSTQNSSSSSDLSQQICQILNIIYETTEAKKALPQELITPQKNSKKNSIEEYKMFCK